MPVHRAARLLRKTSTRRLSQKSLSRHKTIVRHGLSSCEEIWNFLILRRFPKGELGHHAVFLSHSGHIRCIDSLVTSTVFSALYSNCVQFNMPISKEGRKKTKFLTNLGAFCWICMPHGLRNSEVTFQRSLDLMLSGLTLKRCPVYLGYGLVFLRKLEAHIMLF